MDERKHFVPSALQSSGLIISRRLWDLAISAFLHCYKSDVHAFISSPLSFFRVIGGREKHLVPLPSGLQSYLPPTLGLMAALLCSTVQSPEQDSLTKFSSQKAKLKFLPKFPLSSPPHRHTGTYRGQEEKRTVALARPVLHGAGLEAPLVSYTVPCCNAVSLPFDFLFLSVLPSCSNLSAFPE